MTAVGWYSDSDTVLAVAYYAVDQGELTTANDVLAFFEKPWHYPELHDAWVSREVVG